MGMDITVKLYNKNGNCNEVNMKGYRNREFFEQLLGNRSDTEYEYLPKLYDYPKEFEEEYCFGYFNMNIKEFKDWYIKYRPDKHAGWVSKYTAWMYRNKNIMPYEWHFDIPDEYPADNYEFIEWTDYYDPCSYLLGRIVATLANCFYTEEDFVLIYFNN